jgi:SAM-dependent MidA family methyltransferase
MKPLSERITDLIRATGPLPVNQYMALCLFDPESGYYTSREPFGRGGDFITAPEVSQMFGELVAVWLRAAWDNCRRPLPVIFAEIGPGRGTLMKDILRTLSKLDPKLAGDAEFAMVETSERLAKIQKQALEGAKARITWHATVDTLPESPLFIVGNELFDAIPIRQFIKSAGGWRERAVGLDDAGRLTFVAAAGAPDPAMLPPGAGNAPEGAVFELAPARAALMETIAARVARHGGAGLFTDYGYIAPAIGDTLQAIKAHRYEDVLANPGKADLTAHVDFSALSEVAHRHGLAAHLIDQGDFLLGMGLLERAGRLGAGAGEATRERLQGEVERLAGPAGMGTLFKVLAIAPKGTALAAFAQSH